MNTPAERPRHPEIIFYCVYRTYRTILMILAIGLFGFLAVEAAYASFKAWHESVILSGVLGILAAGLALWVVIHARKAIRNMEEPMEISSAGVLVNKEFFPWQKVSRLSVVPGSFSARFYLQAAVEHEYYLFPPTVVLRGDRPLRRGQADAVLRDVKIYLAEHWPNVEIDIKMTQSGFPVEPMTPPPHAT